MGELHGDDGTSGETSDDDVTEAGDDESAETAASPKANPPAGKGFVADKGWASDASI